MVFRIRKDSPDVGDVHIAAPLGEMRRRWRKYHRRHGKIPVSTFRTPIGMVIGEPDPQVGKTLSLPLQITKADPDKQLIFGWASVVEKDGVAVIDKQGDMIPVSELENAAYEFVLEYRHNDDMHRRPKTGRLVESMVFTKEKQDALGIDLKKVAWWTGFKIDDEELWAAHKRGERPEFSIGGAAVPVEITRETAKAAPSSVVVNPQAPNVSVGQPNITVNVSLPDRQALKKTVTTSRDAQGNLTADISEVADDALAAD